MKIVTTCRITREEVVKVLTDLMEKRNNRKAKQCTASVSVGTYDYAPQFNGYDFIYEQEEPLEPPPTLPLPEGRKLTVGQI